MAGPNPNVVNNLTGRAIGVAVIAPTVTVAGALGTAGLIQGTGLLIAGTGTTVLPAIGSAIGGGIGLFAGGAGAATATTAAFASAGAAVAGVGAPIAAFGASAVGAVTATAATASSAVVTGTSTALAAVGLSVSWIPPVAIGIAVVLAAPAIVGGFYEAYARTKAVYDRAGSWYGKGLALVAGLVLFPLNFVSGFFRTAWNMVKGKGYVGSFKATRDQIKVDIKREGEEKNSILGPALPKTFDRLLGIGIGAVCGIVGNLTKSYNSVRKSYREKGALAAIGSVVVGVFRLLALPGHVVQGAVRGAIAGSTGAIDTVEHISTSYQERNRDARAAASVAAARCGQEMRQAEAVVDAAQNRINANPGSTPQQMVDAMVVANHTNNTAPGQAMIAAAQVVVDGGGTAPQVVQAAQDALAVYVGNYQRANSASIALEYQADKEVGFTAAVGGKFNAYDYAALKGRMAEEKEKARISGKRTAKILTGLNVRGAALGDDVPTRRFQAAVTANPPTQATRKEWDKAHSAFLDRRIARGEVKKIQKAIDNPDLPGSEALLAPGRRRR